MSVGEPPRSGPITIEPDGDGVVSVSAPTGVTVEVISGFEEARLIYLGVIQALPVFDERAFVMDIGGEALVVSQFTLFGDSFRIEYDDHDRATFFIMEDGRWADSGGRDRWARCSRREGQTGIGRRHEGAGL